MAFIILGDREQEWERRPLRQAITIGRSFDCELPVRDTLLSRKHCRLEPHGNQWVLIDLKSRNGTRIGEELVTRKVLEDGDVVRIGQTRLCFRAGPFVQAPMPARSVARPRPMDPHEALAATMNGTEFASNGEAAIPGFPTPKPKPIEPKAYQRDGVDQLVSSIASGTWDSRRANLALTRRPARAMPWQTEKPRSTNGTHVMEVTRTLEYGARPTKKPPRWLVFTYLVAAGSVFMTSLLTIL
jgi:predicted component of type VI protein secretion system